MAQFLEYAANIETKSLTSQEATLNHLEGVLKFLDKTRTDDRIIKLVGEGAKNVDIVDGKMIIKQFKAGNSTIINPDGGFRIYRDGKLIIDKFK
ncbi:hypothetical protein NZD88_09075 [Chryseobacterium antibioticum]|uniref:Uncharacterized protein n=1 Tax=Chryseobacterium pyrolae TaxID=2987481 RepID=A0ABT2IGJ7_9FLAO|nr:hypothetical protein [Chryseobacterium pyrolae]MCT2407687.1 hypothetical protein [Chryseobacterium pyrolae]